MDQPLDLSKYQVRTDLVIEAHEMAAEVSEGKSIEGVVQKKSDIKGIQVTHMTINEQAAEKLHKKPGQYLTLEAHAIRHQDTEMQKTLQEVLATELAAFLKEKKIKSEDHCLVVGLGNWSVTPDALGPKTVNGILVTEHLFKLQPEQVQEGFRPVAAITPGVMGTTGLETSDIIYGVIKETNPDFIIVIDALASRSIERVNTTIQIADTGIHPGSGIGNNRKEISEKILGIPVIAIGVPTVVDAVTITHNTIDIILKHLGREWSDSSKAAHSLTPSWMSFGEKKNLNSQDMPSKEHRASFFGMVGTLTDEERYSLIKEALGSTGHNMMVTPKEVDVFIEQMGHVMSGALNRALHGQINQENSGDYTH